MPEAVAPEAAKKNGWATFWNVVLIIDLVVLGLFVLLNIGVGLVLLFAPESEMAQTFTEGASDTTPAGVALSSLGTFVLFGIIPLAWVMGTRRDAIEGTRRYLRLHDPLKGIGLGVLLAIGIVVAVLVLGYAYMEVTGEGSAEDTAEGENPPIQGIIDNLSWPLAVLVALCAGIGEEIFFRGVLQRWVGVWGQAVLFAVAHAGGGYIPQIVVAFSIGLLFGFLVKRGWSLWTAITAHVLYDFILLASVLVFPDAV